MKTEAIFKVAGLRATRQAYLVASLAAVGCGKLETGLTVHGQTLKHLDVTFVPAGGPQLPLPITP